MKIKEVLDRTIKFFQDKGFDSPRLDAELLLAHAFRIERIQLYLKFEQPVSEAELTVARELVKRRTQGEPVAYILGAKGFYGHMFKVGPGVLIPRPESEHVVEEALDWIKANPRDQYVIADLGCGTGCIGLSILKAEPLAQLVAVDISDVALNYAKENAELLGVTDRVHFLQTNADDVEAVVSFMKNNNFNEIDVLVSNPPYIAENDPHVEKDVKAYEPKEALFAENSGLEKLQKWSKLYQPHLSNPGLMLMEMGFQQGPEMKEHFKSLRFESVEVKKDLSGHDRVIRGEIR